MWRQLARDVKISLGLLNVHLCFAVGRNIYDYGGKTVLAVRQFLLLHSSPSPYPVKCCTVNHDSRTKVIISRDQQAIYRKIYIDYFTYRNPTRNYDVIFEAWTKVKNGEKKVLMDLTSMCTQKNIRLFYLQVTSPIGQ